MSFLSKIFSKVRFIAMPDKVDWTSFDQRATKMFLNSEQGIKFIETCRHKLFAEHLTACSDVGNAEYHNAKMKGANDIIFFMLSLTSEESISGNASPANEANTDSDHSQSEALNLGR